MAKLEKEVNCNNQGLNDKFDLALDFEEAAANEDNVDTENAEEFKPPDIENIASNKGYVEEIKELSGYEEKVKSYDEKCNKELKDSSTYEENGNKIVKIMKMKKKIQ